MLPPSRTSTTEGEAVADSAAAAAWQLNEADDVKALGNRWACDRCGADAPGLAEWYNSSCLLSIIFFFTLPPYVSMVSHLFLFFLEFVRP